MLRDFIALVPHCEQTTQIAVGLEILAQSKSDRLVIVSNQQHPLGLLYPARLLSYLLEDRTNSKLQLPLSALAQVPNLIEPLKTLPADWSLEQFKLYLGQEQLQPATDSERALVDNLGRFVGLLDSQRLLQYWILTQQQQLGDRQVLNALVEILDKLPLPLVLQTNAGNTIFENSAWQENFSLWQDTEAIKQEIAELLNTATISQAENNQVTQPETLSTANVYREENLERLYQADRLASDRLEQNQTETALPQGSRCQLTDKPGTCVCICPTPGGQEKVWEFGKIPLFDNLGASDRQQSWHNDLWLLVATDISEQQQLASELAAKNADLIQLNRLKDEFLACISHELKTPITAVMGLSTLLKDRALGELNERQARYAKLIHQSGKHLMAVVNDILDLTRMETGQLKLTLEPVQIGIVCDRALQQAKAMQPKTSTAEEAEDSSDRRFTLTIAPELDLLIADEIRLRQMLVNLLSNAFKFTDADGEVGLQVSRWEGWIAFTVWDTGIGIADAQQHLIFQKFQQLENPLTRQFEGTGLGLVLTRALARLHGGDVTFISQAGQGSTFTLLLPPSPPQPGVAENGDVTNNLPTPRQKRSLPTHTYSSLLPTPPSPPTPYALKGLPDSSASNFQLHCNHLVLVVEAAPKFIEALSTQLTAFGYRVVVARTGTEALEKARRVQPGFIFLNPLLPMLSGWDVLTLLKSDAATSQVPVIITATRAEKEQALLNRADDFLSLPIQNSSLQQVLERYCALLPVFVPGDNISPIPRRDLLTVLWLVTPFQSSLLNSYASKLHYRVLEADDLEQAELLARLWQPDVVVLDGALSDPLAYLQQLRQYRRLPSLPLVTLDTQITQAATQVPELSIFPCPLLESDLSLDTLVTVLQTAAGIRWKPNLSVVDLATLADLPEIDNQKLEIDGALQMPKNEWFQALIQYLYSAGFKSTLGRSWLELIQQIRSHSIDLLLISWGDFPINAQVIEAVRVLSQQDRMPPILVIDRRSNPNKQKNSGELANILGAIATRILPPSVSMEELLNHIHQALKKDDLET